MVSHDHYNMTWYDKHTLSAFQPPGNIIFEENRSNELESANNTLRWVLARENDPREAIYAIQKSLALYLPIAGKYKITSSLTVKLAKSNAILVPELVTKLGIAVTPSDITEILHLTARFMLLNEMELTFFVAAIKGLKSANEKDAKEEVLNLLKWDSVYLRDKCNLQKKSEAFFWALVLCFTVALAVKEATGNETEMKFSHVVTHLLTPWTLEFYYGLKKANPTLGSFNLIEMNYIHKALSEVVVETLKTDEKKATVSTEFSASLIVEDSYENAPSPSKKRQFDVPAEGDQDIIDWFFK